MKKSEIRKRVAAATDKHVHKAIDSVARGKAFDEVYDALRPEPDPKQAAGAGDVVMVRGPAPVPARMSPAAHAAARLGRK